MTTRRVLLGGLAAASVPLLARVSPASAQDEPPTEPPPEGTVALNPSTSARNVISGQSAAVLPVTVRAVAGQTANLTEWQDAGGDPKVAIGPGGRILRPLPGGRAPFAWEVAGSTFNGRWDPTMFLGYNSRDGGPIVAGEPSASLVIETDYDDGTKRTMEQYFEARSTDGSTYMRPLFFQTRRDATTPESFITGSHILGNPFVVKVPRNTGVDGYADAASFWPNRLFIEAPNPNDGTFLSLRTAPDRGSGIRLGANGVEDVTTVQTFGLNRTDVRVNGAVPLRLFANPRGVTSPGGGSIAVGGIQDTSAVGFFGVNVNDPSTKGVVVRGRAGQTGNLFEVQDPSVVVLGGFDKNGHLFTAKNSEPTDLDVKKGQLYFWFDAQNSRLQVKGRDNANKIRTASLNMQ